MKQRQVLIIGDSHTEAIKMALKHYSSDNDTKFKFTAYRLQKIKKKKRVGDISLKDCIQLISKLDSDDLVFSTMGGNLFQIFGLIQHSIAFDMFEPNNPIGISEDAVSIPYQVIWDIFESFLREKDGSRFLQIRSTAKCPVFHIAPPPPKKDTAHLLQHHDSYFVRNGLIEKGISSPSLRLKIWKLELQVLRQLCDEFRIRFVETPSSCLSEDGFLHKDYYANDATHGNTLYGSLILQHIEYIVKNYQKKREFV